jgi:glyoxylase-like metal-dependent hydrolase (beta-lactamase superfamily II)
MVAAMRIIDVRHLGRERVIGCWELDGVLIDPGPESCLATLLEGLGEVEPRAILLTHIHFDHAGATGALLRRWPELPVYVHRSGARHLADPSRLVASATRIYGEDGMREMWGEVVPVAEASMHPLDGGETVLGEYRVAYTPGHASHHVCYLHEPSGAAIVGDVAGVRIDPVDLVVAPTPPPDIDVEAWDASLEILRGWAPEMLGLTHFGAVDHDVPGQLDALHEALHLQAERVKSLDLDAFVAWHRARVEAVTDPVSAAAFIQAAPPAHLWHGLKRYWDKKAEISSAA